MPDRTTTDAAPGSTGERFGTLGMLAEPPLADRETFGSLKGTGPLRQVKLRGLAKVDWIFVLSCTAHNPLRLPRRLATQAQQVPQPQCA